MWMSKDIIILIAVIVLICLVIGVAGIVIWDMNNNE